MYLCLRRVFCYGRALRLSVLFDSRLRLAAKNSRNSNVDQPTVLFLVSLFRRSLDALANGLETPRYSGELPGDTIFIDEGI